MLLSKDPQILWWESLDFHFPDHFPPTVDASPTYTWHLSEDGSIWCCNNARPDNHSVDHLPPGWVWGVGLDNHKKPVDKCNAQVVTRYRLWGSAETVELATAEEARFNHDLYFKAEA